LLRSWVQIPPGPFLSVVQLRYYFEFNLDNCRTKLTIVLLSVFMVLTVPDHSAFATFPGTFAIAEI
jgi:hypothetical protein